MMAGPRITLLGSQHHMLVEFLTTHQMGHEKAAALLFKRLRVGVEGLANSDRYILKEIIPFEKPWITDSSGTHVDFLLAPLRDVFRRCEDENLVFGFVHNHPLGPASFSITDDENELKLLTAIANRNGLHVSFVSMLWADDVWMARVRHAELPNKAIPVRHISVISDHIDLYDYSASSDKNAKIQARQASAFGGPFVDMLQSLRVGIVGCGGTGSPLATLIARAGIGELILIDGDELEFSNLNRVRGATTDDVGENKARNLKKHIDRMGLSVNVATYASEIDNDSAAVDALASCDVVFGCTDDFAGREIMNVALYVYAQIFIDLGLGGLISDHPETGPRLRNHFGRISTVFPESGQCLFCQKVIREDWINAQLAFRKNPDMSEEEAKERYLVGGNEQAPGIGPFTGGTADFALATLFNLIKPFRRYPSNIRKDMFIVDFVTMEIRSYATTMNPDCPYCQKHEFLLLKESYRLQRPILGKRDEYN